MFDLIFRNANLPDGRTGVDIAVTGPKIAALRLKPARLVVVRRGKIIARTKPRISALFLDGRPAQVDSAAYAPKL